jgi:hypothetical protein|tara:strand:- start:15 stop:440 length:426 start_codon:yes stop_codon:yes gene_type:complete
MAMSKCKECGKAVSTKAKTCPSCGVPKPVKKIKKNSSGNFFEDFNNAELELAPAFWIFGVIVLGIGSFILGYFAVGNKIVLIPYVGLNSWILICLGAIAEKYIKEKRKEEESTIWGQLTYVYIGLSVLGVIYNVYDTFTNY